EDGRYFGPFINKAQLRKAVSYLMCTFALNRCNKKIANGCLDYHIGNCSGSCLSTFNIDEYRFRFQLAVDVLEKNHARYSKTVQKKIKEYSEKMEFEKARNYQKYLENMAVIFDTLNAHFSQKKYGEQIDQST